VKDAHDFFAAGGTADQFRELAKGASEFECVQLSAIGSCAHWEGNATDFESAMRSKDTNHILDRIFVSGTSAGRQLAELARIAPARVERTNPGNQSFYRIFPKPTSPDAT
jgi:hypothetical protein